MVEGGVKATVVGGVADVVETDSAAGVESVATAPGTVSPPQATNRTQREMTRRDDRMGWHGRHRDQPSGSKGYAVDPIMTTEATTSSYSGIARILDRNGLLIDVGKADLSEAPETGSWNGTLSVFKGSSVESKHITALVELADGRRALATVGPKVADLANDLIAVAVHGVDDVIPF